MVGSRAHFPILYLPVAWRHVKYQTYVHCVLTQKYQKDQIWLGCLARTSACFLVCQSAVEFKQISRPARTAALVKMHRKAEDKASRISTQTRNSNRKQLRCKHGIKDGRISSNSDKLTACISAWLCNGSRFRQVLFKHPKTFAEAYS